MVIKFKTRTRTRETINETKHELEISLNDIITMLIKEGYSSLRDNPNIFATIGRGEKIARRREYAERTVHKDSKLTITYTIDN